MFQSTWGQPNQQQPSTSTFGQQQSTFGTPANTSNAFGSNSTFGQPQQPQVNPMFGNITTTPNTNPNPGTSAFGAFGNTTNTGTGGFGASKPASGFGAFSGGTGGFGTGTSAFGQPPPTNTTSAFGQPSTSTGAFGGGGNLFGNKSAFGGTGTTAPPTVTTGTSSPTYAVTTEKDGTTTLQFQSISCMPAYIGYSFDELRMQDYAQGRKTASTTNAFGATNSAFGATQPAATNVFGQPSQQPGTAPFGSNTNTTGFGAFGQPASTNTNTAFGGGGVFGQPQPQPSNPFGTTGAFGQQQQQQQQQQQPQQQTSSLFGGTTSAFGSNANKPAFGTFGNNTGGFGSTGTAPAFGTTAQQNPPPQGTGLFGTTAPSTGTSAFGAFGNNNANKPSIFGTNPTQPATNNPFGGGIFGGNQQQQSQPGTSAFGTGTSIFGTNPQQNQPVSSLFGNPPQNTTSALTSGTGLFGNLQQNQPAQQTQQPANPFGNLLGPKPTQPAGTSLFGGGMQTTQPQQQTSLFGNSTLGQPAQGGSIFGKPAAPALGTSLSGNTFMGQSLFGNSTTNQGTQGTLTASIAQPIGENLPIFDMLPPGPRIISLDQSLPKKKAGFFLDMPTRSPVPRVPLGHTPATSKLRGFGSTTLGPSGGSISLTIGKPGALVLNKADARGTSVGPDFLGRSSSPALGSGARQSVKKVILDKKIEPSELFVKSASPNGLKTGKVVFSPQLSVASREKDAELVAAAAQGHDPSTSPSRTQPSQRSKSMGGFGAKGSKEAATTETRDKTEDELVEGDYWVKPELSMLKKAGYDELSSYSNLIVGRKGYGEVHFLESVDLTGLSKLGALLGDVVRFDDKECSVYPDSDDADKPPPGSGLNVKARLILERCWTNDKAAREPIKDPNHVQHVKHLKKLKNMKGTQFESFDMKTGTWTFTVDHF